MPTRSSRNVTREAERRDEVSPVLALEDDRPKKKPRRAARTWEEFYQALVDFFFFNGNCNVPQRYKDSGLSQWVSNQRRFRSKLTPEQKDRLTKLGFNWETREEKDERVWNEFFEKLKAYRKEYLDCCVPKRLKEDPSLGKWVANQRNLDKRGKLLAHRKEKLELVDFSWSINATPAKRDTSSEDEKWFVKYEALLEFHNEHGHSLVSNNYEKDKALGKWVSHQRNINKEGRMTPTRFQLLEDIDFVWHVDFADPEASLTQRQWDEMYKRLLDFKETNGHPNVPQSFTHWGLGTWVTTQRSEARNGFMDPRRADKLNAVAFTWDMLDVQWEDKFASLLAFKRIHGDCKVLKSDGKLGDWVINQRKYRTKGILKPEREARLEAVGFSWNGQSRNETVVQESGRDVDANSAKGSSDEANDEVDGSEQARGSRSLENTLSPETSSRRLP
jgi:hypothetical protein